MQTTDMQVCFPQQLWKSFVACQSKIQSKPYHYEECCLLAEVNTRSSQTPPSQICLGVQYSFQKLSGVDRTRYALSHKISSLWMSRAKIVHTFMALLLSAPEPWWGSRNLWMTLKSSNDKRAQYHTQLEPRETLFDNTSRPRLLLKTRSVFLKHDSHLLLYIRKYLDSFKFIPTHIFTMWKPTQMSGQH